jgi:multiple antibiotic resistance protein
MARLDLLSAIVLLLTVMDPIGNVPSFVAGVREVPPERRTRVIARELLIALGLLLAFLFGGPLFVRLLRLSPEAILIGGGIMLFVIAIHMIFPTGEEAAGRPLHGEPFMVPLATPLVAGPSVLATLLLLSSSDPGAWWVWLIALLAAWSITAAVLLCSPIIARLLREKGSIAVERLMGMILVMISVQMFLDGLARHAER